MDRPYPYKEGPKLEWQRLSNYVGMFSMLKEVGWQSLLRDLSIACVMMGDDLKLKEAETSGSESGSGTLKARKTQSTQEHYEKSRTYYARAEAVMRMLDRDRRLVKKGER